MNLSFAEDVKRIEDIEQRLSKKLLLSDLLNYALLTNPSITSSKASWKMAIENLRIGKSYPDPQLMTTYFPAPIETRLGPQDWSMTLSQAIPFPGKLARQGKVLEKDGKISKLKLDKTIKNIVRSVSDSFYELIYIQNAIRIAKINFNLNQELLKISENSYADDKALFYDVAKAQAQTAQIQYDILLLEELEQTEKTRINTLVNRSADADLGVAQNLAFRKIVYKLDDIYKLSQDNQEDILIADEKIQKADEMIKLSKFENLPSFKLGLFYAAIGDPDVPNPPPDAGDDAIGIQFGLTLPLWFEKNKSKISKARAGKQKARAEKMTITNKTTAQISRLWFKLQNSKRLITLYKDNLIPQSLRSVKTAETWYRQGEGSFSDFLEIQATAYNFQLSLARAKTDYGKTLIKLEQLAGVILGREIAENQENLTPSEFKDSLNFKTREVRPVMTTVKSLTTVLAEIETMKHEYEKKIGKNNEILFISDLDSKLFSRLVKISQDKEAVKRTISHTLVLDEIEILSALRNPGILSAQKKIKAEIESFDQVMDLDANLKQYSAFTEGINTKIGPLKMKDSIKQKYPFPGLTSLKGQIISQQVAVLVGKLDIARKNVITQTRKAYWDTVFVEQSIKITSETIDAFNRLNGVAKVLYKSGKTSYQDIIKINIKIEILKEDLVTLSSKKRTIGVKLLELLNLPPNTRIGAVVLKDFYKQVLSPAVLYPLARKNRQELKIIRHKIRKIQRMIEMSESMIQEPFTLSFSSYEDEAVNKVGTGATKSSFPEKTMASMKNKSPLKPWYGIDDPWLNQTKQKLLSLKQTLVKQENATDRMVRDAWAAVDKNTRELDLYKKRILPLSKSALDVATREYEAGSIPFSQAIDSYTYWLKVKLTLVKKQTDIGISTANLEKIIGKSF
jgi:outer membrane protein TolC